MKLSLGVVLLVVSAGLLIVGVSSGADSDVSQEPASAVSPPGPVPADDAGAPAADSPALTADQLAIAEDAIANDPLITQLTADLKYSSEFGPWTAAGDGPVIGAFAILSWDDAVDIPQTEWPVFDYGATESAEHEHHAARTEDPVIPPLKTVEASASSVDTLLVNILFEHDGPVVAVEPSGVDVEIDVEDSAVSTAGPRSGD